MSARRQVPYPFIGRPLTLDVLREVELRRRRRKVAPRDVRDVLRELDLERLAHDDTKHRLTFDRDYFRITERSYAELGELVARFLPALEALPEQSRPDAETLARVRKLADWATRRPRFKR